MQGVCLTLRFARYWINQASGCQWGRLRLLAIQMQRIILCSALFCKFDRARGGGRRLDVADLTGARFDVVARFGGLAIASGDFLSSSSLLGGLLSRSGCGIGQIRQILKIRAFFEVANC